MYDILVKAICRTYRRSTLTQPEERRRVASAAVNDRGRANCGDDDDVGVDVAD
jgi:hypothetical protein